MGWVHTVSVRGITYTQGSRIYLQSNAPAYTSCDKSKASTTYYTTDAVYFYGRYDAAYSAHPYCVSRTRPGQADYYIDEAHFPYAQHTVWFHANGGTGAPGAQTKVWGTILTLSHAVPTRTGHTFLGWSSSPSATVATYAPGGQYGADVDVTLYAVWRVNTYRVTYNANGGSCATSYRDCSYNSTTSHPTPTRVGHTFMGWYTGNTQYFDSTRITGNVTLSAHWHANEYVLTLHPNGGSINGHSDIFSVSPNLIYNSGNWTNVPVGTRTGYTFMGYYTSPNGGTQVYNSAGAYVNGTVYWRNGAYIYPGHVTFYARWAANSYRLTVKPNGGTYNNSSADSVKTVQYGSTHFISNPTRTGYTFMGWTVQGQATLSNGTLTMGASDVVLIANWTIKSYVVTFNGTANGGNEDVTQGYNHGDSIGSFPSISKKYHKFVGWFTAPDESGTQVTEQYIITSNTTLYAHYVLETTLAVATDGSYNPAIPYMYFDSEWQQGITYAYTKGEWKQGIGGT